MTNQNANKNKWDEKEIGVLWARTSKTGSDYFTGKVNVNGTQVDLVIFSNKGKLDDNGKVVESKSKHPDYRIYLSEPRENAAPAPAPQRASQPVAQSAPRQAQKGTYVPRQQTVPSRDEQDDQLI